ncbi:mitochondrial import inner membrane translocase subunit tim54 [Marasmius crinis-equi]|uniref:Mitochondrial import inner membrane translocase subunit TIM54 n=1 Tax=Marasmius crinis-equi TaxID=585013 RepID=A0ABR3G037_9AGAR
MSTHDVEGSSSKPLTATPARESGIRAALKYTGIPPSWLDKRPKLPSRNWLIFLSVTSSVVGYYIYDRRQCRQIRQEYVEKVKHLSEATSDHLSWPRKVTVYAARWPGDEDWDQCMRYFRKYVKPIFVAAAIDYELVIGKRHGDLTNRIAEEIRKQRRLDAGIDIPPGQDVYPPNYPFRSLAEIRQQRLAGGIVIVGRPTWKEFMAGLKKGWTEGLEAVDHEEALAQELEMDGRFDELEEEPKDTGDSEPDTSSTSPSSPPLPKAGTPPIAALQYRLPPQAQTSPSTSKSSTSQIPEALNVPPASIPLLPPILFVPFTNFLGFSQVPRMIWGFFNERHKVRSGAEAGYRLVMNTTCPFNPPPSDKISLFDDVASNSEPVSKGDLDHGKESEVFYRSNLSTMLENIEKERQKYYDALPAKLETARALSRGTREPTKEELENPPKTEVELRAERMKKEKRWRADTAGWDIVKPDSEVEYDERFKDALRMFIDP